MKPNLILLFNHTLTTAQTDDAHASLGVGRIIAPPPEISALWAGVPPEADTLKEYLAPVFRWMDAVANQGDYVLVQGEFGATWLAVNEALRLGLVPVYSTTKRQAEENHLPDGEVQVRHLFSHVRFRRYE